MSTLGMVNPTSGISCGGNSDGGPGRWPLLVFALTLGVYALSSLGIDLFTPIQFHHQAAQADAFLHGRLDIERYPRQEEMAHFEGRAYVVSPPGPAVLLLPIVAFAGPHFNPLPMHLLAAAASVAFLWAVLWKRGIPLSVNLIVTAGLAFGTVLWWCALRPGSWFTSHVFSFLFLSAALWAAHFRRWPTTMGVLVAGSALCRQLTLFAFPYFLFRVLCDSNGRIRRDRLWPSMRFILGLTVTMALYMWFNAARFGDPWEGGYRHLYLRFEGLESFEKFGLFSPHYLPKNLYTLLFSAPTLITEFPYLKPDMFGQAIVFTSPFLLCCFRARWRLPELGVTYVCVLSILIPQLFYFNNGFAQFGYRFALDFIPLLLLLTADGSSAKSKSMLVVLVVVSVALNVIGIHQLHGR